MNFITLLTAYIIAFVAILILVVNSQTFKVFSGLNVLAAPSLFPSALRRRAASTYFLLTYVSWWHRFISLILLIYSFR